MATQRQTSHHHDRHVDMPICVDKEERFRTPSVETTFFTFACKCVHDEGMFIKGFVETVDAIKQRAPS